MICEKHKFYQEIGFCPSCKFEFDFIHPKLYQISDLASRIIDIFEEIEDEIDLQRLDGLNYKPTEIDKLFNIEVNSKKLTINDFKSYLEQLQKKFGVIMNKRALIEKICNSQTPEEAWKIIIHEWNYIYSLQDASEEWWSYRNFLNNLFKIFKQALKEGD